MDDVIGAIRDWLPVPVYPFFGGPFDGKRLKVDLVETDHGMMVPEVWHVSDPLSLPITPEPVQDMSVTIHAYRFVARRRSMNEGHYEWIDPSPSAISCRYGEGFEPSAHCSPSR